MADANLGLDLFGEPVSAPQGGPGRPAFSWSLERSNKVLLAFARGLGHAGAAQAVGCSTPTLRKVFFRECALRKSARLRLEIRQLERLNAQAEAGNVTAEKALADMLEKQRLRDADRSVRERASKGKTAKPAKPQGVKAQRQSAAQTIAEGSNLYAQRPAPEQFN